MPWRRRWIAGDEVVALAGERIAPRCDLAGFFLGAEVDGAEPLALLPVALEPRLDLVEVGRRCVGFEFGDSGCLLRRAVERLTDAIRRLGQPLLGRDDALLRAAAQFARLGELFERLARRLVGGGECRLADGELVGRLRAGRFGDDDLGKQRRALGRDFRRLVGELLLLGASLAPSRAKGRDLPLGVGGALAPRLALDGDGGEAAGAQFCLAGHALEGGPGFRSACAVVLDYRTLRRELLGDIVCAPRRRRARRVRFRRLPRSR